MLADRVHQLVQGDDCESHQEVEQMWKKTSNFSAKTLKLEIDPMSLQKFREEWPKLRSGEVLQRLQPFSQSEIMELRDELVEQQNIGLQAIETQHTMAFVLPLTGPIGIGSEFTSSPALEKLRGTFEGDELRKLLEHLTGLTLRSPICALIAVPPGGHIFPQHFPGIFNGGLGFTLFLTETWWNAEEHGGFLEIYGSDDVSKVKPQGAPVGFESLESLNQKGAMKSKLYKS